MSVCILILPLVVVHRSKWRACTLFQKNELMTPAPSCSKQLGIDFLIWFDSPWCIIAIFTQNLHEKAVARVGAEKHCFGAFQAFLEKRTKEMHQVYDFNFQQDFQAGSKNAIPAHCMRLNKGDPSQNSVKNNCRVENERAKKYRKKYKKNWLKR